MRIRRGFTLIEVMLASMLGTMIVAVCIGMFGAIARADERSAIRAQQVLELSRAHATAQKAMRLLVMDQPNLLTALMTKDTTAATTTQGRPRIILERDQETGIQRLELVVAEPPILGSKRKAGDGGNLAKYAAVRGAFELRITDPTQPEIRSLYWVNYVPGRAEQKEIKSESLLAANLKRVDWRLAKANPETKKLVKLDDAQIASWNDLPAYVEMDVETTDGTKRNWMFEVCWSVAAKPKFGGIMDLLASGDSSPDETRTDGTPATPTDSSTSGTDTASSTGSNSGPHRMSRLEFLQVMVAALRNIHPTEDNQEMYNNMLQNYEETLRDLTDRQAAGGH